MSRRRLVYVLGALVLVAGLVVGYLLWPKSEPQAAPEPPATPSRMTWADGTELAPSPETNLIREAAERELLAVGLGDEILGRKSYRIELTVDKTAQDLAKRTVTAAREGQPANLRSALVAVDPKTGRIVAYQGHQPERAGLDYARVWFNPGTAFTPFTLVALLHKGKGLSEAYDGTSPQYFGKNCRTEGAKCIQVSNSGNSSECGSQCTVARATELSANTVFAAIAYTEVGTRAVAKAAIEAGIPANIGSDKRPLEGVGDIPPDLNIAIGGGQYVARPVDMAGAYATFAANGTKRTPHIVAKVIDPDNGDLMVYDGDQQQHAAGTPAFDKDPTTNAKIARNVTESLIPVVANNANLKCADNRPCAGKTGTHGCAQTKDTKKSDNCAAWMVGYTPQISVAIVVATDDNSALKDAGKAAIDGSGLPGKAWQSFMNGYLAGKPAEQFIPFERIGKPY